MNKIGICYLVFMKTLNENQYNLIKPHPPKQRGNVKISNLDLINAVLYVAEKGVLERLFIALQKEKLIKISVTCLGLDSTSIKVHPDAAGALKKMSPKQSENHGADGRQKFIILPRMIDSD